jgi:hypothetical protein
MGKQVEGHHENHDHHDHHDHQDEHSSELRHDKPAANTPVYQSHSPNDPLNFTRKHPLFDIQLEKKGPEFSEIDDRRLEYIQKYAGKVPLSEIHVPKNIAGSRISSQDWLQRQETFQQIADSGERLAPFRETASSMPTLIVLTRDSSILSSSLSSCTDGGDTLPTPTTREDTKTMTNGWATSTTNSIRGSHLRPNCGLGQDDTFKTDQ